MNAEPESLLEQARKMKPVSRRKTKITDEHIELALAWARSEIPLTAVVRVLGYKRGGVTVYTFLCFALRHAIEIGRLSEPPVTAP